MTDTAVESHRRGLRTSVTRQRTVALAVVGVLFGLAVGSIGARQAAPNNPIAQPSTGAGDLAHQLTTLQARIDTSPDDIAGLQAFASVAIARAAQTGDPAYYGIARRALERATELAPDDPGTLTAHGELALALHRFADALRYGERALRAGPDSLRALGVVVDAHVELGQYELAAATLQQMLDMRPSVSSLSRASYMRELHGDLDGAAEAMARAEQAATGATAPAAAVAALRGDIALQTGALDAAQDHYTRARQEAPDLVAAAVGVARVQAARGDLDAAEQTLTALVDRLPTPSAVTTLADVQRLNDKPDDAAASDELARTLTRLQVDSGQSVDLELALFEADRSVDTAAAVQLARHAHRARPDNVYAADALAWALARDGRHAQARRPLRRALRLGSADPLMRFHAAWILAHVGERDEARQHLAFVAERNPWFSLALLDEAAALADELDVAVPAAWR